MSGTGAAALVAGLAVVGALIRVATPHGLSVEEIRTANLAHLSLGRLIAHLAHGGTQPPLYPALESELTRLLGTGDFVLRLPALVAGVALIAAAAWLADELFDRRAAVVAALFAAVAPALVWYSQEASAYVFVALFGTLSVRGAVGAIRRGKPSDWIVHVVAAALAVWSDWSGIFIVLATEVALAGGLMHRRRANLQARRFLAAWALGTLALASQLVPLGLLFASQLRSSGGLAGVSTVSASGVSFYTGVSNVAWALFGFHPSVVTSVLAAVWPLAMLVSLLMVGRRVGRRAWLLLICAAGPALGVLALGLAAPRAFDIRYAIASVPLVLVLLARTATAWPRSRLGRGLVVGGVSLVLVGAVIDQQLDPRNPRRYDYAGALTQVQRHAVPSTWVFYEPVELRAVFRRMAPGLRAAPLTTRLPTRDQARSVFVLTSFANQPRLLALRNRQIGALRATRHLVSHHTYPGIQVWWFR
jgi:hypothetical protein